MGKRVVPSHLLGPGGSAINANQAVQEVINACGAIGTGPEPHTLNVDFNGLFDKMQGYRTAKGIADNRRAHHKLTEHATAQELTAKQEFMAAYRAFYVKHVHHTPVRDGLKGYIPTVG